MSPAPSRIMLLVVPVLVMTGLGTAASATILRVPSPWLIVPLAALLLVSFKQLTLTAFVSLLGIVPRRPAAATRADVPAREFARTALLVPIYNETPEPIAAAVAIMAGALRPADDVTIFVLSDTQDPDVAAAEARLFAAFSVSRSGTAIHYRRRARNIGRKAGNIAEFCNNAGLDYDFAIILDADSLMTADAIRALIAALRDDPGAGLIQTVSYPVGGNTLFARMQQFAARLSTPMAVAGQHLWQGRRGTYWGHNAIVRLSPFTRHAELPRLPGRAPMGGEILCHDTIEAALLLRAGWEVRLAPDIVGSYETIPTNLVDHLARERRWCQGNLQHLRLVAAPRLRPESRIHIGMGILHYVSMPLGLALSALLLADDWFAKPGGDFAAPAANIQALLLWFTVCLLFGPRIVSLGRALLLPGMARGFGGRARLLASALLEQVATMLLAPVMAVSVTGFVLSTFAGRVVRWDAAARGDRSVGWREAWLRLRWHTAVGLGMSLLIVGARPDALPWLAPFLLGLILSVPAAMCSGSVWLGELARRCGLFLTEDELMPTAELAALYRACASEQLHHQREIEPTIELAADLRQRTVVGKAGALVQPD